MENQSENQLQDDKIQPEKAGTPIDRNSIWEQEELQHREKQRELEEKLQPIARNAREYLIGAIILGVLFYFCFFDFYENIEGLVYPLFLLALYEVTWSVMKKQGILLDKRYLGEVICSFLLAISTVLTTNDSIIVFNTLGIIILYLIMLCRVYLADKDMGTPRLIKAMFRCVTGAFSYSKFFFKHAKGKMRIKKDDSGKRKTIMLGITLAAVFLVIVLPLLSQADPVFHKLLSSPFQSIRIDDTGEIIKAVCFIFIPAILFYGLVCSCYVRHMETEEKTYHLWKPDSIIIMTSIIATTYILFCGIQIFYLFGGWFKLPEGITYAEYARQGFIQLLWVAVINVGLVLVIKIRCTQNKKLNHILFVLSVCTVVMIISSAYRMILYVQAYDLTRLRFLVLWFLIVLIVAVGQMMYYIYHSQYKIGKRLFQTALIAYMLLSFCRMDYIIAKYNISANEYITSDDLMYLTCLSKDATPAIAELPEERVLKRSKADRYNYVDASYERYFYTIENEYKSSIRGFNISKYIAYQCAVDKNNELK
ncbi:DUF4153 domain-containing protein [Anaerosporobacter sp.]|uniref:DUF4153 domain-containing protein n=1 Tax=Anaerosporobacter sp. TaxID=1872529 RepID=UPI00286F1BF6|nr:DUF4173 domain-containing protein [Anaerosporobacter sp.]